MANLKVSDPWCLLKIPSKVKTEVLGNWCGWVIELVVGEKAEAITTMLLFGAWQKESG